MVASALRPQHARLFSSTQMIAWRFVVMPSQSIVMPCLSAVSTRRQVVMPSLSVVMPCLLTGMPCLSVVMTWLSVMSTSPQMAMPRLPVVIARRSFVASPRSLHPHLLYRCCARVINRSSSSRRITASRAAVDG